MVSRTNKRHYSTVSVDNSPFSHVSPLPLPSPHYHPQPLPLPLPLPFTNHPLPYPPPGAIVAPASALHPHPHPHPQYAPQQQQQQHYQPPQREIKFIFETGRKEPKTRKITKTKEKDSAQRDITGCSNGRKVLANKSIKDPNITRKPKPSPLNLTKPAKLPLTIDIDHSPASYMPSPPLTAGLFPSHHLPKIAPEYPYSPQSYHRHFPHSQQVLPPIETFRSVNMIEGFGSSSLPGDSPPLPINAPIPKAPIQTYTPFFEDSLEFQEHEYDHSEEDGEYEMEVEVEVGPNMGLGLDLGEERREMMDFVPRKPSLDIMMHDEEVELDSEVTTTRSGIGMGLGLGLFN
ncbi:hypothetical protein I302_102940 [Kwoniella bestiolae CBS 10118]|uniref:Uncharacterized protein n=1 Tax=Kwoniella bestiolae CBS 10118 TaxID=1296100 RepID=A0A1B9GGK7_9TREE|nr:hypothetical protein I302_01636 [Kwoniella bestiolae CBS 10118]OCF30117.1 hypothetical protein I302_01636 [Kwoniella bestiolae CBS 10118]